MADKLQLYNQTLGHLEQDRLRTLSEAREPRRVLDDYWDSAVRYCLERRMWNFSYRSVSIEADGSDSGPSFGFLYAFKIPDDWLRTRKLSAVETFDPPLLQVAEEAGYWYTNITPIFVQYNSIDPQYGLNLGAWPELFADYVSLRLARRACKRITGSVELLNGPDGLIRQEEKAGRVAAAVCAMNEAVGMRPQGSWVLARRGFASQMPGPGGDSPTGGGLVP